MFTISEQDAIITNVIKDDCSDSKWKSLQSFLFYGVFFNGESTSSASAGIDGYPLRQNLTF